MTTPTPLRNRTITTATDQRPLLEPRTLHEPRTAAYDAKPSRIPPDLAERLATGVCVFTSDTRLGYANPAAQRLIGQVLSPNELRGELVARLDAGSAELANLRPGAKMVVVAGGRLLEVDCQQTADGGVLWLITDSSSELRLRAQLAEEASWLAHGHEAFLVVDQRGFIRYANQHAERERGAGPNGLVGRNLAEIERPCTADYQDPRDLAVADLQERLVAVVRDGGPLRYTAWHRRQDGGELPVEATMRPHRISHETVLLLCARDDSRRLMHLQALLQAKAEAETANRAKTAFLAVTSHELRTPLTGIIGFCELLALEVPAGATAARDYLTLIAESSQSLQVIINDIVDISKIESRSLELKLATTDVEQAIDLTTQLWSERANSKGLKLVRRPSIGSPAPITTDPQRLRQMLDNLLSNALKFSERGTVELNLHHLADGIEITVTDQGCGIAEEVRDSLFQAFWQAADHHIRAAGGNGLGLYISKHLAELLGGKLWLHTSELDEGSAFKLRLPNTCVLRPNGRLLKSDVWLRTPTGLKALREH